MPPLAGALEYRRTRPKTAEPFTLGILQGYVPNEGDAWRYTLDSLSRFFERVPSLSPGDARRPLLKASSAS